MRRLIHSVISLGLLSGLILAACQQDEFMNNAPQREQSTRIGGVMRCEITTTAEGQLDSLLTVWVKKNNVPREVITHLTVSGPINSTDLSTMCAFQYLDSLMLQDAEMSVLPRNAFRSFESEAAVILPNSLTKLESNACNYGNMKSVYVPDNVTEIGTYAFESCYKLQEVHLPKNLTELKYYTFYYCSKLTKLTLPTCVTKIGNSTFMGCSSLTSIELPDSLQELGTAVFQGCSSLEKAKWASSVKSIPNDTFYGCTRLKFTIPDYITSIDQYAFFNCKNITEFQLPANVTSVGEGAFYGTGIRSVTLTAETPISSYMFAYTPVTNVTLEEGITTLPAGIFQDCTELESIQFPSSLKSTGNSVFSECTSLKDIALNGGLETIGNSAFASTAITSLLLPSTVTKIDEAAFSSCKNLNDLSLNEGLETIGYGAFRGTALTSVSLPSTVRTLGGQAFSYCDSLKTVTLNEGLTSIGNYAFESTPMVSLTIPASVTSCGSYIVASCHHITSVIWNSAAEAKPLNYSNYNLLLYLPEGGKSSTDNKNQIVNGTSTGIFLTSVDDYHCPQAFTASSVKYSRTFNATSGLGSAGGWQTIVLPFDVTSIQYGDKTLAPFGAEVEGAYPFWLRELAADGTFVRATKIEANKPYIIAMPNNSAYSAEYNISGPVTFSASDVTIPVTEEPAVVRSSTIDFYPTYQTLSARADMLVLNTDYYWDSSYSRTFEAGSAFVASTYTCYAFQAYVRSHTGTRAVPISDLVQTRSAKALGPIPMEEDM